MFPAHESRGNDSYSLFEVGLNFHNEVEGLESALKLVTVYVGAFAVAQFTLRVKLHVVYDEAMATRTGIHFVALTPIQTKHRLD